MRVLLTGATGFLGAHVARLLLQEPCTVYAVIRPAANRWRIDDVARRITTIEADVWGGDALRELLHTIKPDLCIHLAWPPPLGGQQDSPCHLEALTGSLRLLRELIDAGCRRILIAGTCEECDTTLGYLSETTPPKPHSVYAAAKHALHVVGNQLARAADTELLWLRFFSLYGPFEDARRLVPSIILPLLRGQVAKVTPGTQVRDYLYVEDAALAIRTLAMSDVIGTIHVASGRPISVGELALAIGATLDRRHLVSLGALRHREADPAFVCGNAGRLLQLTGWSPQMPLDLGVSRTIAWWRGRAAREGEHPRLERLPGGRA